MTSTRREKVWTIAVVLGATLIAGSCSDAPVALSPDFDLSALTSTGSSTQGASLLKRVRAATSRYHAERQAVRAGYVPDPVCVAVPGLGGMGHHWANFGLVDPVFDPLQPEVVLYAPDARGRLQLVAVEYIVIDVGQPAPTFDGQPFDVGGTPVPVPHWSLHVWVHLNNPNGMFTPFNPNVSCPT